MFFRASAVLLLCLAWWAPSRADPTFSQGWIQLRPGYQVDEEQGLDTLIGRIWKKGGMEIRYDIGRCAGNYSRREASGKSGWLTWHTERSVKGRQVEATLTWDRMLYVTVDGVANFYGHVRSDEEITDLLLMAMSYRK
jgi:hypothetical protein